MLLIPVMVINQVLLIINYQKIHIQKLLNLSILFMLHLLIILLMTWKISIEIEHIVIIDC